VRRGAGDYVFVLVPGGREIDWKKLRAHLGVSRLSLPDAEEARAATGYEPHLGAEVADVTKPGD
jgi:prolyl-tRNA editing enzyme YbaK/EbsC (Cys-tRNA(Pro) deacylase)